MVSGLRTIKLILANGEQQRVAATGDFIRIDSATGNCSVISPNGDNFKMSQGKAAQIAEFKYLDILNEHGATNTVIIEVGSGKIESGELSGSVTTSENIPSTLTTTADASVTGVAAQKVAANLNRKELIVSAKHSNTDVIYIGDASVSTTRGIGLQAGQIAVLKTTAALWSVSLSGTQKLEIMEI